jgi:hypothetical protein
MKLRTLVGTLVPAALATTFVAASAAPARAQQWPTADPSYSAADPSLVTGPEVFGSPGQIVVSSDFDLDLVYSKPSGADEGSLGLRLAPALMFFVARNVAVGGLIDFQYVDVDSESLTVVRVGPLVGYNLALGPRTSLMPTVGLTYQWSRFKEGVSGGQMTSSSTGTTLVGKVPLLFHPFTHVFVGLAPYIIYGISGEVEGVDVKAKERTYGVTLDLGFWL